MLSDEHPLDSTRCAGYMDRRNTRASCRESQAKCGLCDASKNVDSSLGYYYYYYYYYYPGPGAIVFCAQCGP